MTEQDILNRFTRILRDLLMDDDIALAMNTRREDVPNWDSFAHVNFIVAAETELGIRFNVAEVESFDTVGDIVTAAAARLR
jgi:acyl carrier protein